jgi:hypothetical protein
MNHIMNNISNEKIFRGKIGNICLIEIDNYDFIIPKLFIVINWVWLLNP